MLVEEAKRDGFPLNRERIFGGETENDALALAVLRFPSTVETP
jgi:hypothetical protein